MAGLYMPFDRWAGRTRVRDTDADLPAAERVAPTTAARPLSRAVESALVRVGYAASQILAYTNLFADDTAIVRYGRNYSLGLQSYREELATAFGAAAGDTAAGETIAARARAGLLDDVILPYDSLFGQAKDGGIRGFTSVAHAHFLRWLRDSSRVAAESQSVVETVHARWLNLVEALQGNLRSQWHDSRLVWLPVQLALTEDQYDEQSEVDRLVERVVGRRFADDNELTYLRSSELPIEIARSILAARDYHVLWTHDITGRRDVTNTVDDVGYTMVADAYLPALTQAVARYDSVGRLPVYMIMLDEFYYEQRDGRLWMDILERPLTAPINLPRGRRNAERAAHLRERQEELRWAVAHSNRLQQDAAVLGGDAWLRRVVKVNVNIVLPSDFSFRSSRINPGLPFMPDNVQREHRKVAFYDLTEREPYRGGLILTGVGIGEHYASNTWEDRGYLMRGPAAIEVRAAARRALVRNGVRPYQIPAPLREVLPAVPATDGADAKFVGRALQLHNEAGFGAKASSVARAMLYNLAPPGSIIIVPDPLWVSDVWASMLAAAAARGCRVFVISPSLENGPNPQAVVAAMQRDVMSRLLEIRQRLGPHIRAVGGELRVGLYTARADVTDIEGRRREITEGLRRSPWIRGVIPFDSTTLAVLNVATVTTEANGKGSMELARDELPRAPQLHQKTQLVARPGAVAALARQPGWDVVLAHTMEEQSRQSASLADRLREPAPTPIVDGAVSDTDAPLASYERQLSPADRKAVSFYFSLGTQNQDPRGIMQDGELSLLVSGLHAAVGLVDLYYIMARSTWVETQSQLDRLLPPTKKNTLRLARMIRWIL